MNRFLIMLMLFLLIICLPASPTVFAATLYVPDHHATIQGAIDAAVSGDTVMVRAGTYSETIDLLGKAVTLKSEDVTPAPYNQPPYPPAGDTATAGCTVTGMAP